MSSTGPPDVDPMQEVLDRLRARADASNAARADVLGAALRQLSSGPLPPAELEEARQAAHQIAGSAGTFGHPTASLRARDLEGYLHDPQTALLAWAQEAYGELMTDLRTPTAGEDPA